MVYLRTVEVLMTKIFQKDFPLCVSIFKHTPVSNYLKLMYSAINAASEEPGNRAADHFCEQITQYLCSLGVQMHEEHIQTFTDLCRLFLSQCHSLASDWTQMEVK